MKSVEFALLAHFGAININGGGKYFITYSHHINHHRAGGLFDNFPVNVGDHDLILLQL